MDDWLLIAILGVGLLLVAGLIELRIRRGSIASGPTGLRRPSVIVAGIGVLDLVIAVLLRFV
jgi:hypothetical protein